MLKTFDFIALEFRKRFAGCEDPADALATTTKTAAITASQANGDIPKRHRGNELAISRAKANRSRRPGKRWEATAWSIRRCAECALCRSTRSSGRTNIRRQALPKVARRSTPRRQAIFSHGWNHNSPKRNNHNKKCGSCSIFRRVSTAGRRHIPAEEAANRAPQRVRVPLRSCRCGFRSGRLASTNCSVVTIPLFWRASRGTPMRMIFRVIGATGASKQFVLIDPAGFSRLRSKSIVSNRKFRKRWNAGRSDDLLPDES